MTLRWRLTLFYTALLTLLLTSVGLTTLYLMRNSLYSGLDTELRDTYSRFTKMVPGLVLPLDTDRKTAARDGSNSLGVDNNSILARYQFPNATLQIEQLDFYEDRQTLIDSLDRARTPQEQQQLFDTLGVLQNASRRSLGTDWEHPLQLSPAQLAALIRKPEGQVFLNHWVQERYTSQPTLMRLMVVLTPMPQFSPLSGGGNTLSVVYVGRSLEGVTHTLQNLQNVVLLLFVIGLLTAGTGAYLLAGQALRPLRQVQRAAERIGGQNLAARVPVPRSGDEVQSLAQALNAMLTRLERSFEVQRRFTSDASHELRTPVTAISGHASYLLRRTSPSEQQQESLKIIQGESERLTNLIASLLQLARSDSGNLSLQKAPILSTLFLTEIARELRPLAQAQGTTLQVAGQEIAFEGDPDRLKQVIINLTSNALKAGAKTITLQSQLVLDGQQVRLSVKDDGPGIPDDQLERLFDRFYRLEDSRSRDQGGAGLGLSIARGIMDAHGGKIWLESRVGKGTTAQVQLPIGNLPDLDEEDVP